MKALLLVLLCSPLVAQVSAQVSGVLPPVDGDYALNLSKDAKVSIVVATKSKGSWKITPNLKREDLEYALLRIIVANEESTNLWRSELDGETIRSRSCEVLLDEADRFLKSMVQPPEGLHPHLENHL